MTPDVVKARREMDHEVECSHGPRLWERVEFPTARTSEASMHVVRGRPLVLYRCARCGETGYPIP